LRTAEKHKNEDKENDALWATECESNHKARLPHLGLDGAASSAGPRQVAVGPASQASKNRIRPR
jgi:hypothetical protein